MVGVSGGAGPVIGQVWSVVRGLIFLESRSAKALLTALGVKASENSPFCRDFQTEIELLDMFIKYFPRTFKYSGVNGAGYNFLSEEYLDDAPTVPESNVITGEIIRQMAAALAAVFSI